jgi:glycosyltransferase involved in cell wall biosynthesis
MSQKPAELVSPAEGSTAAVGARVGIVYPRATLDSAPSLCNAADLLARRGYAVDLFTCVNQGMAPPRFASRSIRICSLGPEVLADPGAGVREAFGQVRQLGIAGPLRSAYRGLRAALKRGLDASARLVTVAYVRRAHNLGAGYSCFIGVDPDGLVLAQSLAGLVDAPVAYYSLELLLSHELTSPADAELKRREMELARRAAFCVVQDEQRARLFAEDNGIPWDRVVLVPNAPLGPARRSRSEYWHHRFGLPPWQRVVLHTGSLGNWTGIEAILASVDSWPETWALVVHTRYDAESSDYLERLRASALPGRVFFSLKPLPRQEYDELVDGADIGVAFYVTVAGSSYTQTNIQTIGLSSGKIAYYLRSGLPVIVNRAASIAEPLERAGCGVGVEDARDIGKAIARIEQDYADYSERVRAFFDARLDFSRSFEDVLARIDRLAAGRQHHTREASRTNDLRG